MSKLLDPDEHKAFVEAMLASFKIAMKMKERMKAKKLKEAKAKCPKCEGYLYAVLAGPKEHIHMHCKGSCKMQVME